MADSIAVSRDVIVQARRALMLQKARILASGWGSGDPLRIADSASKEYHLRLVSQAIAGLDDAIDWDPDQPLTR